MKALPTPQSVAHLLIVMPSWLGDIVMATPTMRALRQLYSGAKITALICRNCRPILEDMPWIDHLVETDVSGRQKNCRQRLPCLPPMPLADTAFDMAVILPNSFRTALMVRLAGIPNRVGYRRECRGFLLSHRLSPLKVGGRYVPVPTRDYYLKIARFLGAPNPDPSLQLFTSPRDDARASGLLANAGFLPEGARRLVVLNPGANFGDAKMWPPERFAAVGDRLATEHGCAIAASGAPNERPILDRLIAAARQPIIDLPRIGIDLSLLKSVIKQASLMISNDTGPRHMAVALGRPVVTIFGPTDPAWTELDYAHERKVRVKVPCGPCQLKKCPKDWRCMIEVTPDAVFNSAVDLLNAS